MEQDTRDQVLKDQGDHECDVWGPGPEGAEGAASWNRCSKNPGHPNFTPVRAFSVDDLPGPYRRPEVLELVRLTAACSVRLQVTYTSSGRPSGYPFAMFGGTPSTHTGSGMVTVMAGRPETGPCPCLECRELQPVDAMPVLGGGDTQGQHAGRGEGHSSKRVDGQARHHCPKQDDGATATSGGKTCPNPNCAANSRGKTCGNLTDCASRRGQSCPNPIGGCKSVAGQQHRRWWQVKVRTAQHVVFDDLEAAHTKVDFFYDDTESGDPGCGGKATGDEVTAVWEWDSIRTRTMYGVSVVSSDMTTDQCELLCVTHDQSLARMLLRVLPRISSVCSSLNDRLRASRDQQLTQSESWPPMCVVVSHPHGRAKTVTVGEWRSRVVKSRLDSATVLAEYLYSTDTCPGSSGGTVLLFGAGVGEGLLMFQGLSNPCHSSGRGQGVNASAPWPEWEGADVSDSDGEGDGAS